MTEKSQHNLATTQPDAAAPASPASTLPQASAAETVCEEIGGPTGPEPTRYGDWERKGRCSDF